MLPLEVNYTAGVSKLLCLQLPEEFSEKNRVLNVRGAALTPVTASGPGGMYIYSLRFTGIWGSGPALNLAGQILNDLLNADVQPTQESITW